MHLRKARRDLALLLPRLVSAYESGRLVPFIGSGLSVGACTSWPDMIQRLELRAFPDGAARPARGAVAPTDLIERANRAVRALKSGRPGEFERAMRDAVVARSNYVPEATRILARLWWPLVLTTNYDNCYVAAFTRQFPGELYGLAGRSAEDCQRVLTSLHNPGRPLVWALQGHLNAPCKLSIDDAGKALAQELVVGHEEYRRVTYRDPLFRRAFAEVFRQRSLLFLGAGIKEPYLQELFGEVLEIYGPSARPHYAIMPEGEVDPAFMLARFQIRVLQFPAGQYDEVEGFLDLFVEAVAAKTRRPFAWSFGGVPPGASKRLYGSSVLEIERTFLPARLTEQQCVAFPAFETPDGLELTPMIRKRLVSWGVPRDARPRRIARFVHQFAGLGVFGMGMDANAAARSLTTIYDVASALFSKVGSRFKAIHVQLLANQPTDGSTGSSYPPRFVLVQCVRAFRDWLARHPAARCKLVLHALTEKVTMEIAAGRLDVLELLSCDDVRFSTEMVRDDRSIERRVFELPHGTRLAYVVGELNLSSRRWDVEVSPRASLHRDYRYRRSVASSARSTLHELGVVPGSTLHFRRQV